VAGQNSKFHPRADCCEPLNVDLAYADMPRIPVYQPFVNVAMQKKVSGYQYWFHRRLDYRALVKG